MRERTPSQAEGERDDADSQSAEAPDTPYPTPSQAEGEGDDLPDTSDAADDDAP
ncbi:hypothetical protein [Streptomyces thermoalcalitolerans]|uniref:Uncharacterized protein n=1 Tax=Streptomyces thermoalcalitolerans TaxID=65605 RepID=A0ABN1P719_9ACTN